jgi:GT2 family glycosyltransferase
LQKLGVVAIGRNEGDRLIQCLQSVIGRAVAVVYIDSGSTDGSLERVRSLGDAHREAPPVEILSLDLSIPFTAARARNAGFKHLLHLHPDLELVQSVDGDCEIVEGWLEQATQFLSEHPDAAVVCGRRRERFPERSPYNRLCDIEWNTLIGEAKACGGDALMRITAFQQVNGYNPTLIAGEEPELCVRLRQANWKIWRIDAEMTLHDAQMLHFTQWWRRSVRSGHAFAEGAWLHGQPPERHWVRECRSIWLWGLVIPLLAIVPALVTQGWSLLLLLGYPVIGYKIFRYSLQRGLKLSHALLYSGACLLGKFPNLVGMMVFHRDRLLHRRRQIIEYK